MFIREVFWRRHVEAIRFKSFIFFVGLRYKIQRMMMKELTAAVACWYRGVTSCVVCKQETRVFESCSVRLNFRKLSGSIRKNDRSLACVLDRNPLLSLHLIQHTPIYKTYWAKAVSWSLSVNDVSVWPLGGADEAGTAAAAAAAMTKTRWERGRFMTSPVTKISKWSFQSCKFPSRHRVARTPLSHRVSITRQFQTFISY